MAETGWHSPVYKLINKRLHHKGVGRVLPGGWNLAEMPEKQESNPKHGQRPYGIVNPVAVRNQKFTNKRKYADLYFEFEVHADTFDELDGTIIPALTAALQHGLTGQTVAVDDGGAVTITMIRPDDVEYEKVEQIWTATAKFMVQAQQAAAQSAT